MKTLIITICARRDSFGAYSSNCDGIIGAGDTIAECKANILEAIRLIKETLPPERRNSKSKTKKRGVHFSSKLLPRFVGKRRRATFWAIYFRLILFYSVKGKHISLVFLLNGEDELLVFEK